MALQLFLTIPRTSSIRLRFCCDGESSSFASSSASIARFLDGVHEVDVRGVYDEIDDVWASVKGVVAVCGDDASLISAVAPDLIIPTACAASCSS